MNAMSEQTKSELVGLKFIIEEQNEEIRSLKFTQTNNNPTLERGKKIKKSKVHD